MRNYLVIFAMLVSGGLSAQWVNYGAEIQENYSNNCDVWQVPVFQDSSLVSQFTGGLFPVWLHSFGQVFDPTSEYLDNSDIGVYDEGQAYRVDSISFPYHYHRVQSEPDTLYIQFFTEEQFYLYPQPWPTWEGMEDVSRAALAYDSTINRSPDVLYEIIEILDDDDATGDDQGMKSYHIGIDVPAGQTIAAVVSYATGNTYNLGDTMTYNYNETEVVNQVNEFVMRYYIDYDRLRETEVYNHAFIASVEARYGDFSNGWGNQYFVGLNTAEPDGFYHADMSFHLTVLNDVGLAEDELGIDLRLIPNPVRDQLSLRSDYVAQGQMEIRILDSSGRIVSKEKLDQLNLQAGHLLDVSDLKAGIYLLSLTDDNIQEQRAFVVAR